MLEVDEKIEYSGQKIKVDIMRKLLIALLAITSVVLFGLIGARLSGMISASSLPMILNVATGKGGDLVTEEAVQQRYQLPDGFSLSLYADNLPNARFMRFTSTGDLLVTRPHKGDIILLRRDSNNDGRPDAVETLLSDLTRPLGLDIKDDYLYYAESNRISKIRFDSVQAKTEGVATVVIDGLSDNGNHPYKTIRFGPDDKLYLSQGSTCNVCDEQDSRRATMMSFAADGSDAKVLATGLRNSVGFAWAPWSGELYATDNGRDLLGDDFPPCELNLIREGGFYGWPYFNANNIQDPDMGIDPNANSRKPISPAHSFRAHNAPLGMSFIDASNWPSEYARSALVALHGSWNRSEPDGYKVVSLHWTPSGIEERDFLTGFNLAGDIIGRPVDVVQGADGAVYISDDYAGAIYKVVYGEDAGRNSKVSLQQDVRSAQTQTPQWVDEADLDSLSAEGAALYKQFACAACHELGENPARLDHLRGQSTYAAVITSLREPQSPMPVLPLSERQQRALAVYLLRK